MTQGIFGGNRGNRGNRGVWGCLGVFGVRGVGGHRVYGPRADRPHLHARASSESAMSSIARSITFLVGIFASASHCSFSVLSLEKPKQNSYADVCGPTHMQNTRATVLRMHVADMIPTRQVVLAPLEFYAFGRLRTASLAWCSVA